MRKNSIKNIRINEEVMRELSNIIRGEIKDPQKPISVCWGMKSHSRIRLQVFALRKDLFAEAWQSP